VKTIGTKIDLAGSPSTITLAATET
jgi:hypothetical protein